MKSKKIVISSVLLTLTMSSLLAACGKDSSPSTNSTEGNGAPTRIDILLSHAAGPYAMNYNDNAGDPYVKELSRLSGYDLHYEYLGHEDYAKQLTVRFASGELADLIRTPSIISPIHPGAVEQGVFKELGPLIDKYAPNMKKAISETAWSSPNVSYNGKIYAIPSLSALPASRVVYIRQDWLDKLNLKQPKTVDEFLAYFEAVKNNDMNGDGQKNEYGLYVRENLAYSDHFFLAVGGVHPNAWNMVNGVMTPDMIMPGMKDAIAFWKMLYDKGYINPNLFTNKNADWLAGIYKGLGGMWIHEVPNFTSTWAHEKFVDQPSVKLNLIDAPTGKKQGLTLEHAGIGFSWVIPSKVSDAKAAEILKYFEWSYTSEEAAKFHAYGIEGHNYTVSDGKINYDVTSPANAEKSAMSFYQLSINPRGDGRMRPLVVDSYSEELSSMLKTGITVAANNVVKHDSLHMPSLESLSTHPELLPGTAAGTLFLDMFAKVVTGRENLDTAFDKFVAEWKKRGGEAAMKEATEWYNKFHNK